MKNEEILQLAEAVGLTKHGYWQADINRLIAFTNAIEKHVLEKMAQHFDKPDTFIYRSECAAAIREEIKK